MGMKGAKAIAAGGKHIMALAEDGTVYVRGQNDKGQLGADQTEFKQRQGHIR